MTGVAGPPSVVGRALIANNPCYDARLWFLAEAGRTLAGVALCWTSAFAKDLVVHESWRRRGLGDALPHTSSRRSPTEVLKLWS
jgi:GNAT superfamily N-acetyltransferase